MTRSTLSGPSGDVYQLTISTWVYIPAESVDAQNIRASTIDPHVAPVSTRRRIPIMQFGKSIHPREGIGIGMGMDWEGYLGFFWWTGAVGIPWFPDYLCSYWVGGEGDSRKGWFPFAGGKAMPSVDPEKMWTHPGYGAKNFFGTVAADAGTAFYWMPPWRNIFPILPAVHYTFFSDTGINNFFVRNNGPLGPYFAAHPAGDFYGHYAKELAWNFRGVIRVDIPPPPGRMAILEGDLAERSIEVESEVFFYNFWSSPLNYTMQPTPTKGPSPVKTIRVDTGGAGKHFAFGNLVVLFPELENVTYGKPAIPSTLYYDGNINFLLTAKWPEENTSTDQEIVPTIKFSAGGFVLDSWNHIYLTVDMSTMQTAGGQDDKELMEWLETLGGRILARVGLAPPYMETPPKWAMFVNRKKSRSEPEAQFTVYPKKDGHWSAEKTFAMSMEGGEVGIPIVETEKGRWKVTGPNQNIMFAYTHIYFGKYIEPTLKNLNKFVWESKNPKFNYVIPPADDEAAVKEFGTPTVWLRRDKEGGIEWVNKGTGGGPRNIGTKPKDFRPGPGQPPRQKKT